jgi:hypothetical protein
MEFQPMPANSPHQKTDNPDPSMPLACPFVDNQHVNSLCLFFRKQGIKFNFQITQFMRRALLPKESLQENT